MLNRRSFSAAGGAFACIRRMVAAVCFVCGALALPVSAARTAPVGDPADPAGLQAAVMAAFSRGASTVTITPGVYVIPSGTGRNSLEFDGLKDKTLIADHVQLVFQDPRKYGAVFQSCSNVTFRGATMHYERPQTGQGRILQIGQEDNRTFFLVQLDSGYPADADFQTSYIMDPARRRMKAGTNPFHAASVAPQGAPGLVKIYTGPTNAGWPGSHIQAGDYVVCRGPGNMMCVASDCGACTFEDLTIYWGGLFGYFDTIGEGGNRWLRDTLTYGPVPPGASERPMLSQSADGLHCGGDHHGPDIENCRFEGMPDDGIAIHGAYDHVFQCDGNTLVMSTYHNTFIQFHPGEPMRIEDDAHGHIEDVTVTAVEPTAFTQPAILPNGKPYTGTFVKVTVNKPVDFPVGSLAANPTRCGSGYRLIGNTIHNHMARGMLLKADDGLVENNVIDGSTIAGIVITPQPWWGEAGYSRNVVIRGNIIRSTNYAQTGPDSGYPAAITIAGAGCQGNRNILIEDNTFEDQTVENIAVTDAQDVTIRNNRFVGPFKSVCEAGPIASTHGFDPSTLIWLGDCTGVTLSGNTVVDMGPYGKSLVTVASTASAVTGEKDGVAAVTR